VFPPTLVLPGTYGSLPTEITRLANAATIVGLNALLGAESTDGAIVALSANAIVPFRTYELLLSRRLGVFAFYVVWGVKVDRYTLTSSSGEIEEQILEWGTARSPEALAGGSILRGDRFYQGTVRAESLRFPPYTLEFAIWTKTAGIKDLSHDHASIVVGY